MPKGPNELRLDTYVSGGNVANIRHSAQVWHKGQSVLANLATALESATPQLMEHFGPQTGPAAVAAFTKVADNVRAQAAEMRRACDALTSAGDALEDAETTRQKLGNAPASPPADPTQKAGESAEDFHTRQRQAHAAQSQYAAESAERERQSQAATTHVDTTYTHAISVMESIHGRPATWHGGRGGTGGSGIPGSSVPGPSAYSGTDTASRHWTTVSPTAPTSTGVHDPGAPVVSYPGTGSHPSNTVFDPPVYGHPGVPQGPTYPGTSPVAPEAGPAPSSPASPAGPFQVPGGTTASSTVAGTLLSGGIVTGTSGLTNALRANAVRSLTAEEQAALVASRTSGTTVAGSTATGARAGAVGTSRATSGMAGRGARGAGGGAGAGGRRGRGKRKKRPGDADFYADDDVWTDGEEASPPVLR